MKTTAALLASCLALLPAAAPAAEPAAGAVPPAASPAAVPLPAAPPAADVRPAEARVTIPVGGMTCGGCVNNVSGRLRAVEGVKTVAVDLEKKRAVVTYDAATCSPKALTAAIAAAGFEPGVPVGD